MTYDSLCKSYFSWVKQSATVSECTRTDIKLKVNSAYLYPGGIGFFLLFQGVGWTTFDNLIHLLVLNYYSTWPGHYPRHMYVWFCIWFSNMKPLNTFCTYIKMFFEKKMAWRTLSISLRWTQQFFILVTHGRHENFWMGIFTSVVSDKENTLRNPSITKKKGKLFSLALYRLNFPPSQTKQFDQVF